MTFRSVMPLDRLWSGEMNATVIDGTRVLLVNIDGAVHAFENRCAHLGLELHHGTLCGHELTCAHHGWQYDARSGCGINPEAAHLKELALKIEDGQILVDTTAEVAR